MKFNEKFGNISDFVKAAIDVIVIDIEGTTTPISFVTKVLFPYVKSNIHNYLTSKWTRDTVVKDVQALRELAMKDFEECEKEAPQIPKIDDDSTIDATVKNILWQMSQDRKSTALKQIQGHMWRSAYEDGTIKGEVYEDVPKVLEQLKNEGKSVYVYSSGSIAAQKLLFSFSDHGDMCDIFSGYFDTTIGSKKESSSYKAIAESIKVDPSKILFLTDVYAEAEAASKAHVNTCILLRPGNKPLTEKELSDFTSIKTFNELVSDEPEIKRQKTE